MADLFDPESLLQPLAGEAPAGPEPDYDPAFLEMEKAGAGKPEQQFGDTVIPAVPPDWRLVHEQALGLAARTRDLRVAIWLTRSACHLHGMAGAARGLALVQGLIERHWAHVHPQLDPDDGDATMRLNALATLYHPTALPQDLRAAPLGPPRGLTLRELEIGLGAAEPRDDEVQATEAGVLQALAALLEADATLAGRLAATAASVRAIDAFVRGQVGSQAPDGAPLLRLAKVLDDGLARCGGQGAAAADGADADTDAAGPAGGSAVGGGGTIRTRADAVRELERVCQWLEKNEPSNPAPLLIRRAQRLMNMSFIEIIRDMAAGGLDQVETIAGPQGEG